MTIHERHGAGFGMTEVGVAALPEDGLYRNAVGAGRPSVPVRKHAASERRTRRDGVFTVWMRQGRKFGGDADGLAKESW